MKKHFLILFLIFSCCIISISETAAAKKDGLYTKLEYTAEFFPDYGTLDLTFYAKRSTSIDINSSYDLYITSYRITLNKTLMAYVDYTNDRANYIPEMEIKELNFDKKDYEINTTDYEVYHKLVLHITAVKIDKEGNEFDMPDDYITVEVFFLREANLAEVGEIALYVSIPLAIFTLIYIIRSYLNSLTLENVSYFNMWKYLIRLIFKSIFASRGGSTAEFEQYKYERFSESLQEEFEQTVSE